MKTTLAFALSCLMFVALPAASFAQHEGHSSPSTNVTTSLKGLYDITTTNLMKTAEMVDEEFYAYRPTEEVRTLGQILAHVANAQYAFCSAAAGEDSPSQSNYEETATAKTDIVAALGGAFEYCNGVYARMTDEEGGELKNFFGRQMAGSAILAFNSAHNYEHYGNLVTYMRINGIVPPSSM